MKQSRLNRYEGERPSISVQFYVMHRSARSLCVGQHWREHLGYLTNYENATLQIFLEGNKDAETLDGSGSVYGLGARLFYTYHRD